MRRPSLLGDCIGMYREFFMLSRFFPVSIPLLELTAQGVRQDLIAGADPHSDPSGFKCFALIP